jgi:hypothetical protein
MSRPACESARLSQRPACFAAGPGPDRRNEPVRIRHGHD